MKRVIAKITQKKRMRRFKCSKDVKRDFTPEEPETLLPSDTQASGPVIQQVVYSAYYGPVTIPCVDKGNGKIALESVVSGQPNILVKCIDAKLNGLDVNQNLPMRLLRRIPATIIDVQETKRNFDTIQSLMPRKETLTPQEMHTLYAALIYNNPVDIHFAACLYLKFLHTQLLVNGKPILNNVTRAPYLISLHNVPRFENAYYSGRFFVVGNGRTDLFPLGTLDTIGHELQHAVSGSIANFAYQGESGALDESFSDVMGAVFEFWVYQQVPGLLGSSDWLQGEDSGNHLAFISDMSDPFRTKQPKTYKGQYWATGGEDNGGVHVNSSLGNFCFYNCAQASNVSNSCNAWIEALTHLRSQSGYHEFRDALVAAGQKLGLIAPVQTAIKAVGL